MTALDSSFGEWSGRFVMPTRFSYPRRRLTAIVWFKASQRWEALNHTIAVNRILGYENRVGMTNRPDHSPNDESNAVIYAFFEHFLQSSRK